MLLYLPLNWPHQISPVSDGSWLKSPRPRKKLGLAVCKRFMLFPEVLAVRLPMSPEALNEKPVETALADGTIPFRKVGKEKTDRVTSNIATGTALLIRFAQSLPCNLLLKTYEIHS